MIKGLLRSVSLLAILVPFASAQSTDRPLQKTLYPGDDVVFQNLCAPDSNNEFYEETWAAALDDNQLAKLRIELLERGFDPGFDPDALDADARLAEAIRMFQALYLLPVTGQPDASTLSALSVPIEKTSDSNVQRAKPTP